VLARGAAARVVVADLGEVVVSRVGVAAVAVVRGRRQRLLVVPLDGRDPLAAQDLDGPVRVRAERAEVAEGEDRVHPPGPRLLERRAQREVVRVEAAEEGDAPELARLGDLQVRHERPSTWQV
jgi:hypothetical protein